MKTTCDDQRKVAESLRASTYSGEYLDKAVGTVQIWLAWCLIKWLIKH